MHEIDRAVEVLQAGGLVAFPTETVYGLGADATNTPAVQRLFAVKGRPSDHPVIVHVADFAGLDRWGMAPPPAARTLAATFWPGPCTLIVRRRVDGIVGSATGGRPTVGLRVPDHPLALDLLRRLDGPIAAPSANRFGRVSPTSAGDVRSDLGADVDMVLDGGECRIGLESTIVDCTVDPPVIRREGGATRSAISATLDMDVAVVSEAGVAPGTLPTHYAPRATVELVDEGLVETRARALAARGMRVGVVGADIAVPDVAVDLSVDGGSDALAHDLYRRLRFADALGLDVVLAVAPPPERLGSAVTDRLRRAAGRA